MKPTELMIGDLVTFKDCQNDANPIIIKIWQINADGDSFAFVDGWNALDEISIDDDVVGIPLTAEILEKNGFISGEFYAELLISDWQIMSDCKRFAARNDRGWHIDILCEYVHELQHALHLCGINKEIEL